MENTKKRDHQRTVEPFVVTAHSEYVASPLIPAWPRILRQNLCWGEKMMLGEVGFCCLILPKGIWVKIAFP